MTKWSEKYVNDGQKQDRLAVDLRQIQMLIAVKKRTSIFGILVKSYVLELLLLE